MAITFITTKTSGKDIIVPPLISNKGSGGYSKQYSYKKSEYVYAYKRGEESLGIVLNPKIDYLIVTIPLPKVGDKNNLSGAVYNLDEINTLKGEIQKHMINAEEGKYPDWKKFNKDKVAHLFQIPDKIKGTKQAYSVNIQLAIASIEKTKALAVLQADPNKSDWNFLRIALIPSRLTKEDIQLFWKTLSSWTFNVVTPEYIAQHGKVRRIDFAIDFVNVEIADLLFHKANSPRGVNVYSPSRYSDGTVAIMPKVGEESTGRKAYIYDKRGKELLDLIHKQGLTEQQALEKVGEIPRVRLEVRCKPSKGTKTKDVPTLRLLATSSSQPNRFEQYKLYDFFIPDFLYPSPAWHFFGDSCVIRGMERAKSMLYPPEKHAYEKGLEEADNCWSAELLWEQAQKAVFNVYDYDVLGKHTL